MDQRSTWAERIRHVASPIAEEVTEIFLRAHADWVARNPERAGQMGLDAARYHVTFLAAAVERGSTDAFADYARWAGGVLQARGIPPTLLGEDLAQVKLALGMRLPPEVRDALGPYFVAAFDALTEPIGTSVAEALSDDGLGQTRSLYLHAALAGERSAALSIVTDAMHRGVPQLDIYVDVLQAAQYEIGRLWETNGITVAHEHAATAVTQFVTAQLYTRLQRTGPPRGTLVMAGVEGELHGIGPLMVGDVLEARGWTVYHLGTNLPSTSIVQAVREQRADCVGIAATMLVHVGAVRRLVGEVRRQWGTAKRVVVGGAAFRQSPSLATEIGADGYAGDLREAIGLLAP